MILLDTDHLSVLNFPQDSRYGVLTDRLKASGEEFGTSVVSVEEVMRGWLAEIKRWREARKQIPAYERFLGLFTFFRAWRILPFDQRAAEAFEQLQKQRIRVGTQDLKIAAIALVNSALLLSANLRDFQRVPGLRVEDWLH